LTLEEIRIGFGVINKGELPKEKFLVVLEDNIIVLDFEFEDRLEDLVYYVQ
jgi:homospermidine synthase